VSEPARTNPSPTAANAVEDKVQEALAICGGDAIAALRITLIANTFLEAEIDRLSAAVSSGFARGKVRRAPTSKEIKGERDALTMCRLLRRPRGRIRIRTTGDLNSNGQRPGCLFMKFLYLFS
jgi:hypothetical protein